MESLTVPVVMIILGGFCILAALFGGVSGTISLPTLSKGGRTVAGALGALLLTAGLGLWVWVETGNRPPRNAQPSAPLLATSSDGSGSPLASPSSGFIVPSATTYDAAALSGAMPDNDGFTKEASDGTGRGGSSTVKVTFTKPNKYVDVYFDLSNLSPTPSNWVGHKLTCLIRLDTLRGTSGWGGLVFKDANYRNDYGQDFYFAKIDEEWTSFNALIGLQAEPGQGGHKPAHQDDDFNGAQLNGFAIFFSTDDPKLLPGKSVYINHCYVS